MQVKEFLAAEDVLSFGAKTKRDLLRTLAAHAATRLGLGVGNVLDTLLQREALGSTGIGGGVALPHARLAVARAFGAFARLDKPVEFGAIDDKPVDLAFLLLLPDEITDAQLRPLACVARRLKTPRLLDELRRAPDRTATFSLLIGE